MEFLRFGSSIPGMYWGCCAVDIVQYFKVDPDAKASIQVVSGDGGGGLMKDNELAFLGKTYREIFWNRLKINTFNLGEKPNHAFFAVLTSQQLAGDIGRQWLAILKEAGFEFLRTTSNAVYTGAETVAKHSMKDTGSHDNYIFALFLNIGSRHVADPFMPPKAWTDLETDEGLPLTYKKDENGQPVVLKVPKAFPDPWRDFALSEDEKKTYFKEAHAAQLKMWNDHPLVVYKQSEIEAAGIDPTFAAQRTNVPQGTKAARASAEQIKASVLDNQVLKEVRRYMKAAGLDDVKISSTIEGVRASDAAAKKAAEEVSKKAAEEAAKLKPEPMPAPVPVAASPAPASG